MSPEAADASADRARVIGLPELFRGFATIGLLGFGGVAAISRHVIVEQYRWLSEKEYATVLGVGQVLPGANTVNAAVIIGDRFQGPKGSLVGVLGLMILPILIVMVLAALYNRFADVPAVNIGLTAAGASAAGMVIGTGLKMISKIRPGIAGWIIMLLAVAIVVGFHWPLVRVVLLMVPMALVLTAWLGRK